MRIGIDCRMYGLEYAGIGRYVKNLVNGLLAIDKTDYFILFVRRNNSLLKLKSQKTNVKIVTAEARHYSLKEQFLIPYLIWKEKIDLMHFPHFNVPVFYFGKYVVTIHDLIKHTSRGLATTTKNPLFYWLKYFGYRFVFWMAVRKAKKILVPSKTVALQLTKAYGLSESKVIVTYEGVENKFSTYKFQFSKSQEILDKYKIKKPFLIYVGSVYPHKNIPNLLKAIETLITTYPLQITLVIVCSRSVFWEKLKKKVESLKAEKIVRMVGFVPDEELAILYNQAEAFIFPSFSEGFGLPGLEAMACGLPVLASDIPVFREVYQDAALYFNPKDPQEIAKKIKIFLSDEDLQKKLITKGFEVARNYSWKKMVTKTLEVYKLFS